MKNLTLTLTHLGVQVTKDRKSKTAIQLLKDQKGCQPLVTIHFPLEEVCFSLNRGAKSKIRALFQDNMFSVPTVTFCWSLVLSTKVPSNKQGKGSFT